MITPDTLVFVQVMESIHPKWRAPSQTGAGWYDVFENHSRYWTAVHTLKGTLGQHASREHAVRACCVDEYQSAWPSRQGQGNRVVNKSRGF